MQKIKNIKIQNTKYNIIYKIEIEIEIFNK